jgi:4-hydroxy-tetrahydrodipicolinate reductase
MKNSFTRVAIYGAAGRMGRALIEAVINSASVNLGSAIVRPGSPLIDSDAGNLIGAANTGVLVTDNLLAVLPDFDVLIDFSSIEACLVNAKICKEHRKGMVIGTTGFDDNQKQQLQSTSEQSALCIASNFSTGVNLCFGLIDIAAQVLGQEVDIEISEAHHKNKIDAPSGTALNMGQIVAESLGLNLDDVAVYGREGQTGARPKNTIGFSTVRAGDIVGDHTVTFASEGERIEITHKASSRMSFARGAVKAADWISNKKNGVYDMQDVLGLKS